MSAGAAPFLQARGIWKAFGQVQALSNVDFQIYPDETVALVGDNGAGKSTLIKTLCGALQPDRGEALMNGGPSASRARAKRRPQASPSSTRISRSSRCSTYLTMSFSGGCRPATARVDRRLMARETAGCSHGSGSTCPRPAFLSGSCPADRDKQSRSPVRCTKAASS